VRAGLGPDRWAQAYTAGRSSSVEALLQDIERRSANRSQAAGGQPEAVESVRSLGTSLLTLAFSGNLDAIDRFTGRTSVVGATGLRDCSVPGSYDPNCANVIGRLGDRFYATDFANNLYSVDPATGAATLIGPTRHRPPQRQDEWQSKAAATA
jgi:hypothetical protein